MAAKQSKDRKLVSYSELFGNPRWRKHAIWDFLLAFAGVVGLWGILFFSIDLIRSVWFPAVFGGIISASGLENSLRSGAWSLDIFRPRAVVTDEASD